jgi:HEPN domain-containing protein
MTNRNYWGVGIAIPDEQLEVVRSGAAQVIPSERHAVITELLPEGEEGQSELVIEVLAKDQDEAIQLGKRLWAKALEVAGAVPAEPDVIGLTPPIFFAGQVYDRLWDEAQVLHRDGRHELAVVRAQTACECLARAAIAGAFRARMSAGAAEAVMEMCSATLNDRRTQALIHEVTGGFAPERFKNLDWWPAYSAHLLRRHAIVHRGANVTRADAAASLEAVDRCMEWLRDLWERG